eukprot:CAMPEP_0119464486 /NCGR_PEP_ID=MMETSP1344-20130328/64_1 /TAXON_ID=236787 /ORGANISM="Florenciella parvula, Strain CCMP2471" /LENGTH=150 /DNA_ID=CAMNT_0007496695 /DNA_START=247 /DNA_END=699 /DNA_ORIENTATION=+
MPMANGIDTALQELFRLAPEVPGSFNVVLGFCHGVLVAGECVEVEVAFEVRLLEPEHELEGHMRVDGAEHQAILSAEPLVPVIELHPKELACAPDHGRTLGRVLAGREAVAKVQREAEVWPIDLVGEEQRGARRRDDEEAGVLVRWFELE